MTRIDVITLGEQGPPGPPSIAVGDIISTEGAIPIGGPGGVAESLAVGSRGADLIAGATRPEYNAPEVIRLSRYGILPDTYGATITTAAEAIDATETAIDVASAASINADDVIKVDGERMRIVSKSGNTLTVERGWHSTAATHDSGAAVVLQDDLTASIQALIQPNTTLLFDRPGTYLCTTVGTGSGLNWVLYVDADNLKLRGVPGAALRTTKNARFFLVGGATKNGPANYNTNRFLDATTITINPAAAGARSLFTATAADAGAFKKGRWIYLRTGQTLATFVTQPDGEINQMAADGNPATGELPLVWPTAKPYQQEYFISGTTGVTSTAVTANPAILGVADVTDRILLNFSCRDLILDNRYALFGCFTGGYAFGWDVQHNTIYSGHSPESSGFIRNGRFLHNDVEIFAEETGTALGTSTGSGDCEYAFNRVVAHVGPWYVHLQEGVFNIRVHDNDLYLGEGTDPTNLISIQFRTYNCAVYRNDLTASGSGINQGIRIDATSQGGGYAGENHFHVTSPAAGYSQVACASSGWRGLDTNYPRQERYSLTNGVGECVNGTPAMQVMSSSGWVSHVQQTRVLGVFPAHIRHRSFLLQTNQGWNSDGTNLITVGTDADPDKYVTAISVAATGAVEVVRGHANAGVGLGLYLSTAETVKIFYTNGGSEPTTGRTLVDGTWVPVTRQPT